MVSGPVPLDLLPAADLVGAVLAGQAHVAALVQGSAAAITAGVDLLAATILGGGRIVLLGAGTSGRLAVLEAAEVPGTYGLDPSLIQARVAGGGANQLVGSDAAEDDAELGRQDVAELDVGPLDALVAVAASGSTPYTRAAAGAARQRGAAVISVTTVAGSALAGLADVAIEVPVGPEVVEGSTRLAAGTAQKMVLNTLTTAAMVRLGRVHEHYMVDVVAANEKLRRRVTRIVALSAGADEADARAVLDACDFDARAAIVHLLTGVELERAALLARRHRSVREAVAAAR
jgi:N-acetylmuramic acid 6-phosphate etherase